MNSRDGVGPARQQMRDPLDRNHDQAQRLGCKVFGHDYGFSADGALMRWECRRGCGAGGDKTYSSAEDAARYARAFDRRDSSDLGRRAPLIGLLPLRLWRTIKDWKDGAPS
ncbi:MAG: hypothetical protein L0H41_00425 [Microlunatus sp.]|nr:hypothetical protein [Microlunatus sp.]MDN5803165.1 hypothetical protein [Microlunatus sp.]